MKHHSSILLALAASLALSPLPARAEKGYEAWRTFFNQFVPAGQASNATAVDHRGNVIVVGYTMSPQTSKKSFYTAKYAALDGSLVWSRTYEGGIGDSIANAVAIDSYDNVLVTGQASDANGSADYYTAKYAAADGNLVWSAKYAGPQGGADIATKVVVDPTDNVIVTGSSYGDGTQEDWYTIKYLGSSGNAVWNGGVRTNGAGNGKDVPADLVLDSGDNAIVVGSVTGSNGKTQFYTQKLDGSAGTTVWSNAAFIGTDGDNAAMAVAVDQSDRVVVTGFGTAASDHSRLAYTVEYSDTGTKLWSRSGDFGSGNLDGGPVDVAVDAQGDVIVLGSLYDGASSLSGFLAEKLAGATADAPGDLIWQQGAPGNTPLVKIRAGQVALDGAGNAVVTVTYDSSVLTARLNGATGEVLSAFPFDSGAGNETPTALALDHFGNIAVTGIASLDYNQTGTFYNRIFAVKYDRFRVAVGDAAPGAGVADSGLAADAKISSVSTPSLADNGAMAVKVSITTGQKSLQAILLQSAGGLTRLVALEGQEAPGADGFSYGSFLDPVIAPDGRVAFTGKLAGAPVKSATGVWFTNAQNGVLLRLRTGSQVPDLDPGIVAKSIGDISWRNSNLISLIEVSGPNVTAANSTMLYNSHAIFGGNVILRSSDFLTLNGFPFGAIQSIGAFLPSKGTSGQGRSFSANLITTKVVLQDGRAAVVEVSVFGGTPTVALYEGQDFTVSSGMTSQPVTLKSLSVPSVGSANQFFSVAVKYALQKPSIDPNATVTPKSDTSILVSTDGNQFYPFVREGGPAADTGGAAFGNLHEPLINSSGDVAFIADLAGTGVSAKNKSGLWWGSLSLSDVELIARIGQPAPDAEGATDAQGPHYLSLLSAAMPGGAKTGPIFLAKLTGKGVTGKSNLALFAVDSTGLVRQLIRKGESLGDAKVTAFKVLGTVHGSTGVAHSFNANGGVDVQVTLNKKTQALLHLSIP